MATVALPPRIDPSRRANFPILIGEDLLRDEKPRKRQRISVQYNHRPEVLNDNAASIRVPDNARDNALTLTSKSNDTETAYKFEGTSKPSHSLALIYDHEKKAFVLDRINTDCYFNLRTTPSEPDAGKNTTKYPQIGGIDTHIAASKKPGEDDLDETEGQPPDPNNPYDYRHFLNKQDSPPSRPAPQASPRPNHMLHSSPLLRTTSPVKRPKSRTAPEKPPKARRRHMSPEPPRRTKIHKDIHDPNELVIDMGDDEPAAPKPWHHRSMLGDMLNERGRSGDRKPVSMRSAASSMSPSVRAESDNETNDKRDNDVDEIDLGESRYSKLLVDDDDPEPAAEGNGWDDEVDDILQQEMDQAMESQGGDKQPYAPAAPAESSSESEEE